MSRALSPPELAWDALPSLDKTLQFYAMNHAHQDEQDILVALLELAFSALQANVTRLQKDSEHAAGEEEAEEEEGKEEEEEEKESSSKKKKKKSKRKSGGASAAAAAAAASASAAFASLLSSTHRLQSTFLSQLDLVFSFSGGPSAPVRDAAFAILADSFILFSGKFAASPLHSLVIGHDDPAKLQSLQAAFNAHFDAIMDAPQRFRKGDSREADIADKKFEAFRLAAKVRCSQPAALAPLQLFARLRLCAASDSSVTVLLLLFCLCAGVRVRSQLCSCEGRAVRCSSSRAGRQASVPL